MNTIKKEVKVNQVLLEEIHNPPTARFKNQPIEPNFNIERFREIEGLDELVEEIFTEELI